ncbi:MAG: pitrilysin family protein [Thermoanaerobaculia bacterium]
MRTVRSLVPILLASIAALPSAAQVERPEQLTYPPLPEFDVPSPTRVELDNGMVVILLEDHELPLVDAVARIRTGSRLEPADRVGLASLTGSVMRTGGTESMSGDEIDDFLENRAASVETGIGTDAGTAAMSSLVQDLPEVLDVFADVLRHPVFAQDRIEVAKAQARTAIARQNDNPQGILFRELGQVIYGQDSPYARDATYATLAAIGREDMLAWHERFYHPENVILGLVGDFDTDAMVALVREVFGDWQRGTEAPEAAATWREQPAPGVYFVDKSDVTQSNIALGHLGIRRDAPDYYAVQVLNELFSGGFASRLVSVVRTRKGLAYAVSGSVGSDWDHPGITQLWMSTKVETTGAGIEALREEARRLTTEPPTEEEVAKAKQRILSSFVFNSDSTREILGQQLTYEYYGYPLDWLDRYAAGIRGVSVEEVRRAAAERIHPDDLSIVVVGPEEGMDRPLSDFGPVTAVDVSIPPPPAAPLEVTEASLAAGSERMTAVLDAMGGAEAVAAVDTVVQRGVLSAQTPQGPMQATVESLVAYPDRFRQTMVLPFGTLITVVDGESGFRSGPGGTEELSGEALEDSRKARGRNLFVLLRRYLDGDVRAVATGEGDVVLQGGNDGVRLSPEAGTGLPGTLTYQGNDFAGTPGEVRISFSDWREDAGLLLPFAASATFEGEPLWDLAVDEMEVGAELPAGAFDRPAE